MKHTRDTRTVDLSALILVLYMYTCTIQKRRSRNIGRARCRGFPPADRVNRLAQRILQGAVVLRDVVKSELRLSHSAIQRKQEAQGAGKPGERG
jgi:hypothetical protein